MDQDCSADLHAEIAASIPLVALVSQLPNILMMMMMIEF